MEKLIRELLDTEMNFCQSLKQLVELYLEPLSQNNFLTVTDIKVLFGSILKVIDAQNEFRSELTEVGEHILGDCELLLKKCQTFTTTSGGNNNQQQNSRNDNCDRNENFIYTNFDVQLTTKVNALYDQQQQQQQDEDEESELLKMKEL